MTLDGENYARPLKVEQKATNVYNEIVVSADLLLEFYGVRLQSEYVWLYADYEVSGPIAFSEAAIARGYKPKKGDGAARAYQPCATLKPGFIPK